MGKEPPPTISVYIYLLFGKTNDAQRAFSQRGVSIGENFCVAPDYLLLLTTTHDDEGLASTPPRPRLASPRSSPMYCSLESKDARFCCLFPFFDPLPHPSPGRRASRLVKNTYSLLYYRSCRYCNQRTWGESSEVQIGAIGRFVITYRRRRLALSRPASRTVSILLCTGFS